MSCFSLNNLWIDILLKSRVIDDIFSYGLLNDEKAVDWLIKKPSDDEPPFLNINDDYF